ncbi:MAG: lysostaphin resistance A-like protein [Nannocystales bacterium]
MSEVPSSKPRLSGALLEVGLAIAGLLAGSLVFLVLGVLGLVPTEGAVGLGARMAAGPAITLIAVAVYRKLSGIVDANDLLQFGPPPPSEALFARASFGRSVGFVLLGIVAAIGGSFVLGLGLEALGVAVEEQEAIVELIEGFKSGGEQLPMILLAVSALALAPVAEELLFRRMVFRRIASRGSSWPEAYALSAAAFAAIHTNPVGFLVYLWLGVVFAESYRRTGRIWVAMLVHAGNNAFALSLLVWG